MAHSVRPPPRGAGAAAAASVALVLCLVQPLAAGMLVKERRKDYHEQEPVEQTPAGNETEPRPLADVYFINVDGRTDREDCIRGQLAPSPFDVYRITAAQAKDIWELCPQVNWYRADEMLGGANAAALMCSNYLAWMHAVNRSRADFILLFEDDALITDEDAFWRSVTELLTGPCQDFDVVQVDTYFKKGREAGAAGEENRTCTGDALGSAVSFYSRPLELFKLSGLGTHLQIIRRSIVPELMRHLTRVGPVLPPIDLLHQDGDQAFRARAWMPGLVKQFDKLGTTDQERQRSGCRDTLGEGSIHEIRK